jgi:2-polyprenyl-3-methyl-5-hydroxy-6-metoxy-1,4-benzoquinol methylase
MKQSASEAAPERELSCPACSSQEFTEKCLLPEASVKSCLGCGLLVSDVHRTEPTQAEFARVNEGAYHEAVSKLRLSQAQEVISFVREHKTNVRDWLDVGCSFGYLLLEARRQGYRVLGVEPDKQAFEQARSRIGDGLVRHGLMTDETCPNQSADIVSMMDVLEHIPVGALPDFANMIRRKLRPGGMWIIKVPSTDGAYFVVAHHLLKIAGSLMSGIVRRLWQSEYEFPHTVYFNRATLELFLRNHGFHIVAHRYLEEVPNRTVIDRLVMDNTISVWQAYLISPAFYLINLIEKWRGKSDALLVLASYPQNHNH